MKHVLVLREENVAINNIKRKMEKEIKEVIANVFQIDMSSVCNDETLSALGINSFDCIVLTCKIEEKFDIKLDERELEHIITLKELIQYIKDKVDSKS